MKKLKVLFLSLLLVFCFAWQAQAEFADMWANVYKFDGNYNADGTIQISPVTSNITYQVLAYNADTAETLYAYADPAFTSKTNAVTSTVYNTDKKIKFRVDPTDATNDRYVDLIVTDSSGGYTTVIKKFDKYNHSIIIDERPNVMHHGIIWYTAAAATETSTGVAFEADTMIHDVRTEVVTTASVMTIHVGLYSSGTGGDADGFLIARAASVAGFTADTGIVTSSTSIDYTAATTYGALLYKSVTGSTTTGGTTTTIKVKTGGRSYLGHVVTGTNTGVLTYTCSTTVGSGKGYIHYWFTKLR